MDQRGKVDRARERGRVYRLEVRGAVSHQWAGWFEAEEVTPSGPNTLIRIRVADQAELYGHLRKIHDMNLQLISVQRLCEDCEAE